MRIVLLSGGSGKRLWPLSNEVRSKAFLSLLRTEEGGRESMLQRVCRQLDAVGLLSSTLIVTRESQVDNTLRQIGSGIPLITEPLQRGTYHAIALSAAYLHSCTQADPEEVVCFVPIDVFAEIAFFEGFKRLPAALEHAKAELALLGVRPTSASDQYGYIVPSTNPDKEYASVDQFVEKPDADTAQALVTRGALWNCGIFAFRLAFMLSHLKKIGLPTVYEQWLTRYGQMTEKSFDEEIVRKSSHAIVLPYDGPWNDLGSWETLSRQLAERVIGLGTVSAASVHSHLINELDLPIHVVDVPGIIVAASADGILVASTKNSHRIKDILSGTQSRPIEEE